jgi:F-type H+-transporting ATPase subunit b
MIYRIFAATEAAESVTGLEALGVNLTSFLVQLATFLLLFLILRRYAFTPIIKLLDKRHKTIDDGVRLGQKMEHERAKLNEEVARATREARYEADRIIANSHKEAREVVREAEKTAQRKAEAMLNDAQVRIEEEAKHARKNLEKEIVGLISEATEAIVEEKVDSKKDAELIDRVLKGGAKK